MNGGQVVDAAAELALPITLLRPEGDASPWYWQIAPLIQVGGGGSVDLAAAGLILGGGVVSGLGYNCESFEVMLANEILYYGGLPVDQIKGIHFDTQLSQLFFRNGVEGTWWIGAGFYADMATAPDCMTARVSASLAAKWKYVKITCSGRMCGHSASTGSLTLRIMPD